MDQGSIQESRIGGGNVNVNRRQRLVQAESSWGKWTDRW